MNCVHGSLRVEKLLAELQTLGATLSSDNGRLAFDAPAGSLSDDMLDRMRADREGLIDLINRAGPANGSSICPWCGPVDLVDDPQGLRCMRCRRVAWINLPDGGLLRADEVDNDASWLSASEIPLCPACGDLCDTLTAVDEWTCRRCEPEREQVTNRLLSIRERILKGGK